MGTTGQREGVGTEVGGAHEECGSTDSFFELGPLSPEPYDTVKGVFICTHDVEVAGSGPSLPWEGSACQTR